MTRDFVIDRRAAGELLSTLLDAVYVPPPPEMVRPLLEDLVSYINTQHHPPLVQAALTHSQFIAIHPFADGKRSNRASTDPSGHA